LPNARGQYRAERNATSPGHRALCYVIALRRRPFRPIAASGFIQNEELTRLFARRLAEGLQVVPIVVRDCLWHSEPMLPKLQALPKDGQPIIGFAKESGARDQIWAEIGRAIEWIAKRGR
jgi:hypothetical protein